MAVDISTLAIEVRSDGVLVATGRLDNLNRSAGRAERAASSLAKMAKRLAAALSVAAAVAAAKQLIALADSYTLVEGRIRLTTKSNQEAAQIQSELLSIAQRTRAEYLAVADVYARFASAVKGTSTTQKELLTITETLGKAFIISGAGAEAQTSAMVQLSQAFASGVLRGDEFNSIMESGGRVVDMFADYLGVARGDLREMAEDGKLTADVLAGALTEGAAKVNKEFETMPKTVSQAGNVLKNVFGDLVNDANKGSGATAGIADEIINLANTVNANKDEILSLFTAVVSSARWATGVIGDMTAEVRVLAAVAEGRLDFSQYIKMKSGDEFRQWLSAYESGAEKIHTRLAEAKKEMAALGESGNMEQRQELTVEISGLEYTMRQIEELRQIKEDFNKSGLKFDDTSARSAADRVRELSAQLEEAKKAKDAYSKAGLGGDTDAVKKNVEEIKDLEVQLVKAENAKKVLSSSGFIFDGSGVETVANKVKTLEERINEAKAAKAALEASGFAPESTKVKEVTGYLHQLETQLKAVKDAQNKSTGQTKLDDKSLKELVKNYLPLIQAEKEYAAAKKQIETARTAGQITEEQKIAALAEAKNKYDDATGATKAHADALKEQKKAQKEAKQAAEEAAEEYQRIIDSLDPLTVATREYQKGLAALDQMDPTHGTARYIALLANLEEQYKEATEAADTFAKKQKEAEQTKKATLESELSRKSTEIEISIATGGLTELEALPERIDLLNQKITSYQARLERMPKKTADDVDAWNSQAEAIAQTTLELAKYKQQLRLLEPGEAFKQGMKDWGAGNAQEMADFYRTAFPEAMSESTDAFAQFFRDVAQGNLAIGDSWKTLGESIENTVADILQDLIQLQLKMALMGGLGITNTGGLSGGGLLGMLGVGQHTGGVMGTDAPTFTRVVPASTFSGAPRYHTGLMSNEFAAILEKDESVLTAGQMKAIGKGLSDNSGSKAPVVNMTIHEAPGVKAKTETSTNNDGSIDVVVRMIESKISDRMNRGQGLHKTMGNLYGAKRKF